MSGREGASHSIAKLVLGGCETFLRPVARFCLKAGIGYREFAEITKRAFVSVASEDYGLRGRPTNVSRVAVITGLTRKEVSRIREVLEKDPNSLELRRSPANKVMEHWHSDPDFHDGTGPLVLSIDGDSPSFCELARKYGGDVPPLAMLKELERGSALEIDGSKVRAISRFFEPSSMDEEFVTSTFFSLTNLAKTLTHNACVNRAENGFVERYVWSRQLDKDALSSFKEMSQRKGVDFLDSLDAWLIGHKDAELGRSEVTRNENRIANSKGAGLGIYYFELDD